MLGVVHKDITTCAECGEQMHRDPGYGLYCANPKCPHCIESVKPGYIPRVFTLVEQQNVQTEK